MFKYQYFQFFLLLVLDFTFLCCQHEDIPYQNVEHICKECRCFTAQRSDKHYHYAVNCANKNFDHILARWPEEFGKEHNNTDLIATFSFNNITMLQQLPATYASVSFACSHCNIHKFQSPIFMDVPNIKRLDLSWNMLTSDEMTPDVFRGPYLLTSYEPIALEELDLSHNLLYTLSKRLFEHTPNLTKLNLGYNQIMVIDTPIMTTLAAAKNLKILDLSYTGIKNFPESIAKRLKSLRQLNLAGNAMISVPSSLEYMGQSLQELNLAGNAWERLTSHSFVGLKALKSLNISNNSFITTIENGTFKPLHSLERLDCTYNTHLLQFDLDSLRNSSNLKILDISHCQLSTLILNLDLYGNTTSKTNITTTQTTQLFPPAWPYLFVKFDGNPWFCDCNFALTLQYIKQYRSELLQFKEEARCDTPYILAGARISNLTAIHICAMPMVREYHVIDEDPPRFLRKEYIILTLIIASVVIVLGFVIGFVVVCIRRRLKHDNFGTEPIRYTSVRSSNLSSFNTNGHTTATGTV